MLAGKDLLARRLPVPDLQVGAPFNNFYEETKHLAEVEVRQRMAAGLPATIYRPAIVVGDSHTGETQKYDGPYFIMQWMLRQPKFADCFRDALKQQKAYYEKTKLPVAVEVVDEPREVPNPWNRNLADTISYAKMVKQSGLVGFVAEEGEEHERYETWVVSEVERGVPLPGLYPPNDEAKARYEAWKKK